MKRNILVVIPLVMLLASPIDAQTPYVDPDSGMSLDQAIAGALAKEPTLRAARTAIAAAVGRREQAELRANPTASVERRWEPGGRGSQSSVGVQWPLELFRRGARIDVAEREVAVTQHAVADHERRLAAEVRARYGAALAAIRELAVLDELRSTVQRQLEVVAARAREGAAPPLERDLMDVEVRRLAADRRLQTGRVESALIELRRLLGMPPGAPLTLRETLEGIVARESDSAAAAAQEPGSVVQSRPDVLAAEARVQAADARVAQASAEGRIDVTVFGGYMRMTAGFPQMAFGRDGALERVHGVFDNVAGGAMVVIPLLNRNQGALAAARAEREGAAAARDAAVLEAATELAAARVADAAAHDAVADYRDGAQRLARQNLNIVAETFELGRATVFDVLAEQRRYLEVERAFTGALRSAYEARTRLRLALGDLR